MYPKDTEQRKNGTKALSILCYQLDSNHWDFKQETGNDVGRDCIIELSEDDEWRNHKIEGQIKGRSSLDFIKNGTYISFPLEVKTINYAINSKNSFVLFLVDLKTEKIYFENVQDYILNNNLAKKLENQKTINISIDVNNCLPNGDILLQEYAKR